MSIILNNFWVPTWDCVRLWGPSLMSPKTSKTRQVKKVVAVSAAAGFSVEQQAGCRVMWRILVENYHILPLVNHGKTIGKP